MASSNSYNFVMTRDQLITDAMLHIGLIGEGVTPTANSVTEAARILNMIVKLRAADGMPLWSIKRATILPVTGVNTITNISHIVQAGSYVSTTLSAAEAASQTVLSVTLSTGMTAGDQVGIELDDDTMHWTTIVSVDSSTQITITTALASAAASGNYVHTYTASADRIPRPLRILNANIFEVTGSTRWDIDIEDHMDFYNLPSPTTASEPQFLYYEPTLGDATADPTSATTWYGKFHIYPRFSGGRSLIEFSYQRPFQDFDAASDNPDFPQEFYLPLLLELSALLGPRAGLSSEERKALFQEAKMYRDEALATIAPEGSYQLQPETE